MNVTSLPNSSEEAAMDPKMMMQVPNAVRELAEKSVEQA
jgi:hypothetical protein